MTNPTPIPANIPSPGAGWAEEVRSMWRCRLVDTASRITIPPAPRHASAHLLTPPTLRQTPCGSSTHTTILCSANCHTVVTPTPQSCVLLTVTQWSHPHHSPGFCSVSTRRSHPHHSPVFCCHTVVTPTPQSCVLLSHGGHTHTTVLCSAVTRRSHPHHSPVFCCHTAVTPTPQSCVLLSHGGHTHTTVLGSAVTRRSHPHHSPGFCCHTAVTPTLQSWVLLSHGGHTHTTVLGSAVTRRSHPHHSPGFCCPHTTLSPAGPSERGPGEEHSVGSLRENHCTVLLCFTDGVVQDKPTLSATEGKTKLANTWVRGCRPHCVPPT